MRQWFCIKISNVGISTLSATKMIGMFRCFYPIAVSVFIIGNGDSREEGTASVN